MIGGEIGRPGVELDRPRDADADPEQRPGRRLPREALLEERLDAASTDVGPGGDVGRLCPVREDLAGEVGDRDVDARRAEVGDEQVAGVGAEAERRGRAAAGRGADAVLCDQAVVERARRAAGSTTARLEPVASTSSRARTRRPCART